MIFLKLIMVKITELEFQLQLEKTQCEQEKMI